jgi:hypothetical protein
MYVEHHSSSASMPVIKVNAGADRLGQAFASELKDRLAPRTHDTGQIYHLSHTLKKFRTTAVTEQDGTISRYNVRITVDYELKDASSKKQLSSSVNEYNSYSISDADFADYVAEEDATIRAARKAARTISLRLAAHFAK